MGESGWPNGCLISISGPAVKLLLATEDRTLSSSTWQTLEAEGRRVFLACDGVTAMAVQRRERCDIILLDWALAGIDGLALCRRIRQQPHGRLPYLIVMLGPTQLSRCADALAAGADDWVGRDADIAHWQARLLVACHHVRERAFLNAYPAAAGKACFRAAVDGRWIEIASACDDLTGHDTGLLQESGWHACTTTSERILLKAAWEQAVSTQSGCHHAVQIKRPDGTVIDLRMETAPVFVGATLIGHAGGLIDCTSEAALAREKSHHASLRAALPQTLTQVDATGFIVATNRVTGQAAGILHGPVGEALEKCIGDDLYQTVARQIAIARCGHRVRFETPSAQDGMASVGYDLIPLFSADAAPDGVLMIASDLSCGSRRDAALRTATTRLADVCRLLDHLPQQIALVDNALCPLYWNAAFGAAMAIDPGAGTIFPEYSRNHLPDLIGAERYDSIASSVTEVLGGTAVSVAPTVFAAHASAWRIDLLPHKNAQGSPAGFIWVAQDGSDECTLALERTWRYGLLRGLMHGLPQAVALIDREERIRFHNDACGALFNGNLGSLDGVPVGLAMGHEQYMQHRPPFFAALAGEDQQVGLLVSRHGQFHDCRLLYTPHFDEAGEICGVWCIVTAMAAHAELGMSHAAVQRHDAATGLLARDAFEVSLQQAVARSLRSSMPAALLLVELDDFAQVIAALGKKAADRILAVVGVRMQECVSQTDVVARWRHDQFAAGLECLEMAGDADAIATAIVDRLRIPYRSGGKIMMLTASIGVALLRTGELDAGGLVCRADEALYVAKCSGRNRFRRSA